MTSESSPDENAADNKESNAPAQATVIVRGEAVTNGDSKGDDKGAQKDKDSQPKEKSAPKQLSEEKVKLQGRLPALDDDTVVGVQKDQVVTRDGKADLAFIGTLLASAAPASAPKGQWQEYRVYETDGGKHVFSKISRNVAAEEEDTHEAEVLILRRRQYLHSCFVLRAILPARIRSSGPMPQSRFLDTIR